MKSRGQISQKLKQVRFRHVKKEMSRLLSRDPENCINNVQVPHSGGSLRICRQDCVECDSAGDNRSSCANFKPRYTKEEVKGSLVEFFRSRGIHEIAVRFPDVAALQWVLTEEEPLDEDTEEESARDLLGELSSLLEVDSEAGPLKKRVIDLLKENLDQRGLLEAQAQDLRGVQEELILLKKPVHQVVVIPNDSPRPIMEIPPRPIVKSFWRRILGL